MWGRLQCSRRPWPPALAPFHGGVVQHLKQRRKGQGDPPFFISIDGRVQEDPSCPSPIGPSIDMPAGLQLQPRCAPPTPAHLPRLSSDDTPEPGKVEGASTPAPEPAAGRSTWWLRITTHQQRDVAQGVAQCATSRPTLPAGLVAVIRRLAGGTVRRPRPAPHFGAAQNGFDAPPCLQDRAGHGPSQYRREFRRTQRNKRRTASCVTRGPPVG